MNRPARISFVLLALLIVLVVWLKLGAFLLAALFGYLALQVFSFRRSKTLSVTLYFIAVIVIGAGMIYIANLAYHTLSHIAEMSIPAMVGFAEKNGINLPFTDYESLKNTALSETREGITAVGRYARVVSFQTLLLLAGLVVAVSIFLNPSWTVGNGSPAAAANIYTEVTQELSIRFKNFYQCFAKVIGAQIIISAINTVLTAVFLAGNGYPYSLLLICMVFLCGLIPIAGNLMSNILIVGVGFTLSPRTGIMALVFLVVIHKLEYLFNSKIIGIRINNPMWLMLIGLVVGECLMGIPGMILAPVVLYYIKIEASPYHSFTARD
jgi:predicted PurR-regulated permease PerM